MPMTPGENEVQPTAPGPDRRLLIAIDGPAAAGKTTVARDLADRAGAIFLDTGLLYRAITLAALRDGIPLADAEALTDLVRRLDLSIRPATVNDGRPFDLLLNGEDVTARLRSPEIDAAVSAVAATPGVRAELLPVQRELASRGRVVMVGRDIATVVAPDAELKVYLDASAEERARRRHAELAANGVHLPYDHVLHDLIRRDAADSSRATAPLAKASDAIVIETDGRTVNEIVEELLDLTERTARAQRERGEG
jgi:cytidylate kinase